MRPPFDFLARPRQWSPVASGVRFCMPAFIICVDAIFTTLFERLFTNDSDVIGANRANACVYRACNAD